MKRIKGKLLVSTLFVLLVVTTGCLHHSEPVVENTHQTEPVQKVYMSASWAYGYADVEEITKASDMIALVKVIKTNETVVQSLPFTTFTVEAVIPIHNINKGAQIDIFMTGGVVDGVVHEFTDDPLMQPNEEFLIFCRENADSTYTILGGPQGRLVHEDGRLNSLSVVNERVKNLHADDSLKVVDADAKEIIAQIKAYIDE